MSYLKSHINTLKPVIHWAKIFFTPLAFTFLSYFFWQSRAELGITFQQANPIWLISSITLWMLLHFISPLFTIIVFSGCSLSLNYSKAFCIHSKRLPAKYLPGGIWHTVARAADYHQHGFEPRYVGSYLLIENLVVAAITLALGGSLVVNLINESLWLILVGMLIIGGLCFIFLLPWLVNKHLLPVHATLRKLPYYSGVCCLLIYWLVAASAFICFLKAFPALSLAVSYLIAGGVYIFSWGIGFITLFAPQGIGVSEFISEKLLGTNTSSSHFIALLASFRVIVLSADLMTYGFSKIAFYKKNRFFN